jgi:hypothetical protein
MEVSVIGNTILTSIKGNISSSITELEQLKSTNTDVTTLISDYKVVVNKLDNTISRLSTFNATTFPEEIKSLNTEIDKLNGRKGLPSRFAWPAFENAQPELRLKAKSVLNKTFDSINSQIRKG